MAKLGAVPQPRQAGNFLQTQLKLRQLRLLVVLDQQRQVGHAAAVLNVTQPAISKSLAELEAGVGAPLFVRSARGLVPTEAGLCLIRHAQTVLEQIERAQMDLDSIQRPLRERLSLGVMHGLAPLATHANARLLAQGRSGELQLMMHESNMVELLAMLRARQLDLVLGSTPERVASADLSVRPLFSEPLCWMASPAHPVRRLPSPSLADLAAHLCVLPPRTARVRSLIDAEFRRQGVRLPERRIETLSFSAMLEILVRQQALVLTTRLQARSAQTLGLAAEFALPMGQLNMSISAMSLLEHSSDTVSAFAAALADAAAQPA